MNESERLWLIADEDGFTTDCRAEQVLELQRRWRYAARTPLGEEFA